MIHWKALRWMPAGIALGLVTGIAAADDSEIFTQVRPPVDPNILFVVDTSGSMDTDVIVGENFDPSIDYPGNGNCRADHLYFRAESDMHVPSCLTSEPPFVSVVGFRCEDVNDELISGQGFTPLVKFAQWDDANLRWDGVIKGTFPLRLIECEPDKGVHGGGEGFDPAEVYPQNGTSGPWDANASPDIWASLPNKYTFYTANYINWLDSGGSDVVKSRLDIVKDVVDDVLTSAGDARVGLMRFSSNPGNAQGGMVIYQVDDVENARAGIISALDSQTPAGATPLAETMYEAQQYLTGRLVDFGLNSVPVPSVPASYTGNPRTYVTPIVDQCQRSFVVLLTDGLPVNDTDADARITALPGFAEATGATSCKDSCLDETAKYLANADLSALPGVQNALTYTIGFAAEDQLLVDTATAEKPDGTPAFYVVNDVDGLTNAFVEIIGDIDAQSHSFVAPAVSVDSFNRVANRDDIYFTMFVPSGAPHWAGNVKKYRVGTASDGTVQILDADGNPAVDPATGTFFPTARSIWSAEVDGDDALKGGVRVRMSTARKIYTDTANAGGNVALTADVNLFHEDNDAVTATMLGVTEDERTDTIRFLRGVDAAGTAAQPLLGDSLHSVPVLLSYGGTEEDPDLALYFATNDGYFHAVDPTPATDTEDLEQFAFIPNAMLPRLAELLDNQVTNPVNKAYGLDGPITYWIEGDDGDNVVETKNGEHVLVYVAMRRGGRNYYALDLTDRADPRLAWTIAGGSGEFAELGQSWSAATVAHIGVGGEDRTVLVFGGGYDTRQDAAGVHVDDGIGRAVYIVDAETGERLWWAANAVDHPTSDLPLADMTNSIPSEVRVIDTNADGFADRLYAGDTGGRVWRFDIDNTLNTDSHISVTGSVFASIGGSDAAGNRRFYYPPSVAQVIDERMGSFLTVSIGSGHRENPLGTGVEDRFYVFRDPHVFGPARNEAGTPVYPPALTEASLLDVTSDTSPEVEALNSHTGWMIRLTTSGEKVLSSAFTADNKVFFTTYIPTAEEPQTCDLSGVIGTGRLYTVSLLTGAPVIFTDTMTPDDRHEDLARGGIPPAPVPIFTIPECTGEDCGGPGTGQPPGGGDGEQSSCANPFSQVTLLVATEARDPRICNAPRRTYWHEVGVSR